MLFSNAMSSIKWIPFTSIVSQWRLNSQDGYLTYIYKNGQSKPCGWGDSLTQQMETDRHGETERSPVDSVCWSHGFAWISLMMREGGWKIESRQVWLIFSCIFYLLSLLSSLLLPDTLAYTSSSSSFLPSVLSDALTALLFFDSTGLTASTTVWLNVKIWKTP